MGASGKGCWRLKWIAVIQTDVRVSEPPHYSYGSNLSLLAASQAGTRQRVRGDGMEKGEAEVVSGKSGLTNMQVTPSFPR